MRPVNFSSPSSSPRFSGGVKITGAVSPQLIEGAVSDLSKEGIVAKQVDHVPSPEGATLLSNQTFKTYNTILAAYNAAFIAGSGASDTIVRTLRDTLREFRDRQPEVRATAGMTPQELVGQIRDSLNK